MKAVFWVFLLLSLGCAPGTPEPQTSILQDSEQSDEGPVPIELVAIVKPGEHATFLMGSTAEELNNQSQMDHVDYSSDDERPAHTIDLSVAYAVSKYEITNDQFCQVMNWAIKKGFAIIQDGDLYGEGGKKYLGVTHLFDDEFLGVQHGVSFVGNRLEPTEGYGDHPVNAVTWYGALAFCNFLSMRNGLEPVYDLESWTWDTDQHGYRLPTEAQWEYAARNNLRQSYAWGDSISPDHTNYWPSVEERGDGKTTVPVGFYDGADKDGHATDDNSSPFGVYDMTGNVWEWCWDWYGRTYYAISSPTDPRGPETGDDRPPYDVDNPTKVWRGCGWAGNDAFCRVAKRWSSGPETAINETGFRIARDL